MLQSLKKVFAMSYCIKSFTALNYVQQTTLQSMINCNASLKKLNDKITCNLRKVKTKIYTSQRSTKSSTQAQGTHEITI